MVISEPKIGIYRSVLSKVRQTPLTNCIYTNFCKHSQEYRQTMDHSTDITIMAISILIFTIYAILYSITKQIALGPAKEKLSSNVVFNNADPHISSPSLSIVDFYFCSKPNLYLPFKILCFLPFHTNSGHNINFGLRQTGTKQHSQTLFFLFTRLVKDGRFVSQVTKTWAAVHYLHT